jgi:histidinol dehydrogenase
MSSTPLTDVLTRVDVRGRAGDLGAALPAPATADGGPVEVVRDILEQVRRGGDDAVRRLVERYDGVRIDHLRVPQAELSRALTALPADLRRALEVAHDNIEAYHRTQLHTDVRHERHGVVVRDLRRPVERAGLYVPGGRAPLASTVLMTAVPARVAGVAELVMVSPPGPDGRLAEPVLAAAAIAGVDEVYRVGGAQAVAALAYGTASIRPVDVIVGPGNIYVAIAERLVAQQGLVGVPSAFTGPSEVAVVADATTPVDYAAIDLVVQAEHGPDGFAWLVSWDERVAEDIGKAVGHIVARSPRREEIEATLSRGGWSVLVDGPEQAMEVVNLIAPEHLELMTADAEDLVSQVRSAGAVFVGPWAPASVGDYLAGPNHVLPTARSARFSGGLRVDDFCKHLHVVSLDRPTLERLAPHVAAIATSEGLSAHAESVLLRAGEARPGRLDPGLR